MFGDVVRLRLHFGARVRHRDGQPAAAHHRQVNDVVADVGDLAGRALRGGEEFVERGGLVHDALAYEVNAQVARAQRHRLGDAFGN